jgi:glutathione S-transferase
MITVHHLNNSRSQRILWLLEELEQPYELKCYERDPKTLYAPPALLAVHPLGKSPVITDGEITVAESGAIIEYILDKYGAGRLIPARGTPDRLRYTYWLHFAEGSAMPPLLLKVVFNRVASTPAPWPVSRITRAIADRVTTSFIGPRLKAQLDYMESELTREVWFAGPQFTAADIQMSFPLELAVKRAGLDNSRPKLMAFLERIHSRAAYQRALARGGPYSL